LARYYQFKGNDPKTEEYVKGALSLADVSANDVIQMNVNNSVGQVYFFNENYEQAKVNFEAAFDIAKKNNWIYVIQYCYTNLGEFYLFNDQPELAKHYLDLVVKNKKETELRDLYQVYSLFEYYYQDQGIIDSAYIFAARKNEIDDILETEQRDDLANELDKDFQSEKRKLLLEAKIQENAELRTVFTVVFSLVLFFLILLFLFLKQKSRSNKMLLRQQEEITEKNRQISTALQEKENLLKEIHHRVKNNLQVVSSILNLQSRNITDKEALRIIEEGKERIFAISLIHNQLYLNKDVAFVEIGAYLEKLTNQMNRSFSTFNKQVDVIMEVDDVELSIDIAVPVGLILCELLSNAYKHAFKESEKGSIFIELKNVATEERNVKLIVKDNGLGYKGEIEFLKQQSTGVEIISSLLQQLDARYEYLKEDKGFGILIEFSTNHK
jgi:two-component sensor histidine kinase